MEQLSWAIANLGDGDGALLNQAYITSLDMSPMLQADAKVTAITFQDGSESRGSDCVVRELDSSVRGICSQQALATTSNHFASPVRSASNQYLGKSAEVSQRRALFTP
jgi:hypothetical protein